ncbi:type II toxin-antitoxin system VapC family toxin [Cronbergia sp. UHCC 0137]|uniref:type II toxin-antitoxin system VapC family toxin n=1 Tax=Cronbergia sp. UHCC 0137 TaxID=3110239 RepID=UPI002B21D63C|nr:type II toxin-antitoxin system VapC family toxin [Cronbergia sp. UHCC 0137]MEA5617499.1 type II toxin-antitoxin system VapC family toxin [Cronbergia sp. UHCC 0137]
MSYLLDTNHCSYIINGNSQVTDALKSCAGLTIGVSIITYAELLYMTEKSALKSQNLGAVQVFLSHVDLYFIDEEIAIIYSHLKASIFNYFAPKDKSKRRSVSIEKLGFSDHDLWIAATAIQHNLTLVSADSDFRRIHQVQPFSLESWV